MNFLTLKEDFYKRYETSGKFLHYTSYGALCTLLGHTDIPTAPSLCCTLSMRVEMFARKSGGNYVKIENTTTDKCLQYPFGTSTDLFKGKTQFFAELIHALENSGLKGAEILYNNTIPNFISSKHAFSAALIKSLMQVSDIELTHLETAAICALSDDLTPYLAVLFSKKGYCTLMNSGEPKNLPLPLSGYKILTAHCTEPLSNHSKHIKYAMSEIRRLYPHINSISDLTPEILSTAKSSFKNSKAAKYMYHLSTENTRINTVSVALKRCDIKTLFREINNSEQSMERFWDIGTEHKFLANTARNTDGIAAARCQDKGIWAIVEADKVDYSINMIKSDFENTIGYKPTFCVCDTF